ncbi:hypothetical protein [Streptomyces hydrogenans]|uniref:hypothetical protein n=1 Tax=Streptomyces hydrogenans TaxID=1873719 RepID=UPI0038137F54
MAPAYAPFPRPVRGSPWTAEEAAAAMRHVGYEPEEPYPGRASARWRCRCTTCGAERTPILCNASRGSGCEACAARARGRARIARTAEEYSVHLAGGAAA